MRSSIFNDAFMLLLGLQLFSPAVFCNPAPELKVDVNPLASTPPGSSSFSNVVKKVSPSVVNIYTAKRIRENTRPPLDDALLRQFFGLPGGVHSIPRERREQSLGSGVIVSDDGYILTNNHVVESADEIRVALSDDKTIYDAKVIGTDPQTDVAVIKVEATKLPAITVTDSDKLEVGDVVLAIGNPFGVGQAVTMGIVSAKSRGGMGIVDYEDFIQTDASINPGNSGGALVDADGRLVGINSAILSRSGGNQGIGFAIPINQASSVMKRLVTEGKVVRGYAGYTLQPLTAELAKAFGLSDSSGALIADVAPRSPAAEAGLQEGDVVVEFNGKKVADSRHLRLLGAETPPGAEVPVRIQRKQKNIELTLRLGSSPEERSRPVSGPIRRQTLPPQDEMSPLAGISIDELNGRIRRQLNFPPQWQGVLVTDVDPVAPAAIAGLRAGDVILEINQQPVSGIDEAVEVGGGVQGDSVLLRVWSNGASRYIVAHGPKG